MLVAATENGVCSVKIGASEAGARRTTCGASIRRRTSQPNPKPRTEWVKAIAQHLRGDAPSLDLPIDVQATAFQWKVWRALQRIPYGETRAYAEVARSIGKPKAVRAVARACATNPSASSSPAIGSCRGRRDRRIPLGSRSQGKPCSNASDAKARRS